MKRFFLVIILSASLFVIPVMAQALVSNNTPLPTNNTPPPSVNGPTGGPTGVQGGKTILPFSKPVDMTVGQILERAVNVFLGLIASVAVIFIIVGGFRLAFSQGKSEAVTAGKKTITWAIIGLIVALMAFAIIRIVERILY